MVELEEKVQSLEARALSKLGGVDAKHAATEFAAKLGGLGQLPSWLVPAARDLVVVAEKTFGAGNGAKKKEFVRQALQHLADSHDIKWLPDTVEKPLETALIDFLVEVAYSWLKTMNVFGTQTERS